jgi:hypothetical protein
MANAISVGLEMLPPSLLPVNEGWHPQMGLLGQVLYVRQLVCDEDQLTYS